MPTGDRAEFSARFPEREVLASTCDITLAAVGGWALGELRPTSALRCLSLKTDGLPLRTPFLCSADFFKRCAVVFLSVSVSLLEEIDIKSIS